MTIAGSVRLRVAWRKSAYLIFTVRPAKGPRLLAPGPDLVRHRLHAGLDVGRIGQVAGEGRFRSGGLARAIRHDRTVVLATGDGVKPRTGLAEVLLQEFQRLAPQIRAREDAEAVHPFRRHPSDTMEFATGNASTKAEPIAGVTTNWPLGLLWSDASLARNLL